MKATAVNRLKLSVCGCSRIHARNFTTSLLTGLAFSLLIQLANAQTTQWIRVLTDPESTPPGRESAAMVYDEKREVILMHGGEDAQGSAFSDTWEWDGQEWHLVSTEGPAVTAHEMAYDAARDRTVLYGGRWATGRITGYLCEDKLWEWDGNSWTQIESGSATPLTLFTLVYDRQRGRVIRHGGVTNHDYTNPDPATYEWDGSTWTAITQGTFIRAGQSGVYDSARGRTVAFGGSSRTDIPQPPFTQGTWEFDGAEWNQVAESGPQPRVFHLLAFDSQRKVAVLYGGTGNSFTSFNDTWEWNGTEWTAMDVEPPGSVRTFYAMAYDAKRRKVVLFGGSPGVHNGFLNQTWEYGFMPLRLTGAMRQPDGTIEIQWDGEARPYQLQGRASLSEGDWQNVGEPSDSLNAILPTEDSSRFFRVLSLFGD